MGDWQDWNGDGKVTQDEKAFTYYMMNDMDKRRKNGSGGGCLSCLLLFIALPVASLGIMIHFLS
ncbi:hypothetical protein [Novisyntrophococcus fermenticellae]|uniref:hypothetical protein n=1 Tax=Novisyntrophococcus fermenticellae TaxID=2068655 RepID=UPI001E43B9D2|nr:hypothetical protein [Novisyntrophococcus fermenticellae]